MITLPLFPDHLQLVCQTVPGNLTNGNGQPQIELFRGHRGKDTHRALYGRLLREMAEQRCRPVPPAARLEACFRSALRALQQLLLLADAGFVSDAAEICFYRRVKPRFTGRILHCTLEYQANLFVPTRDIGAYWQHERKKILDFYTLHSQVLDYLNGPSTHLDAGYFLRRNRISEVPVPGRIFDPRGTHSTEMDWLAAQVLAHQWYERTVLRRLRNTPQEIA